MKIYLPDFSKAKVLIVGDLMLDRYWFGQTSRISPEAPVPVVAVKQAEERPGGAGNVALNAVAVGAQVTLFAMVGQDAEAETLSQQLSAAGVSLHLSRYAALRTITKLRSVFARNPRAR